MKEKPPSPQSIPHNEHGQQDPGGGGSKVLAAVNS